MSYFEAQKRFMHVTLLLVFIIFSCFYRVAYAQLSREECSKKQLDLLMSGFEWSGDLKKYNIAQYKEWTGLIALYQGECSHIEPSIEQYEKNLQETIKKCIASGQGSNCGVGPVVTQLPQNNIPVQTKQTTSSDNPNDDPKVFGGGSSLRK